jgi:tRNA modification GTPase
MDATDTICAIATARGPGAIGIVRLSGPRAREYASALLGDANLPTHGKLQRRVIRNPATGEPLDEGMVVLFEGPNSYTGDDLVELQLHGSQVLLAEVVDQLLAQGARMAAPGEFTMRAFLNGKMDLSQAEAVHDLVDARSVKGLKLAAGQVLGRVREEIEAISEGLLQVAAALEAELDFPDDVEDMDDAQLDLALEKVSDRLQALIDSYDRTITWKEGFRVVLAGTPNAGKSSLFNALLGRKRAIVSREAGTTRDYIEEFMPRCEVPVLLVDTAGVRDTDSEAESAGVGLTKLNLAEAHLVVLLVDLSRPWETEDRGLAEATAGAARVVVGTKADLAVTPSPEGAPAIDLAVSVVTGDSVQQLHRLLTMTAEQGAQVDTAQVLVTSRRQLDAIVACKRALSEARHALKTTPRDIVSSVVRRGLHRLGEVTGQAPVTEQIMEEIFSNFCIGK